MKTLLRPQVWAVTSLHISSVIAIFGSGIFVLALIGAPLFSSLDFKLALMLAFALSFSSPHIAPVSRAMTQDRFG